VAGSFWARPREEEESGLTLFTVPASTLTQGEGKGASGGLEVQALRGKGGNEGGESAGLQVYAPGAGKSQAKAEASRGSRSSSTRRHCTSRVDSDSRAGVSLERLWLRPFTHEARTKPGSLGLGSWAAKAWPT
jgi:hypothetical protein